VQTNELHGIRGQWFIAGSFSLERERVQLAKVEILLVVGLDGCTKRCLRRRHQK